MTCFIFFYLLYSLQFFYFFFFFFFFNDTATTEIYTLSLHDALPIRGAPSPMCVNFEKVCSLSRLRALARSSVSLLYSAGCSCRLTCDRRLSRSIWEYQTSIVGIAANRFIAIRYSAMVAVVMDCRTAAEWLLMRPATARLATSRLMSHSHGPGSVSSKSLTSNTMRRSGDAYAPKLARCASPQLCTRIPESGVDARSAAVTSAAPRKNVKGDASIRLYRMATNSGTLVAAWFSSNASGSGRRGDGENAA